MKRLYKEFGRLLKELRGNSVPKLTQQELADKIGLKRTSVTNIELGNQQIPIHILYKLASALNVSPAQLLPDTKFASDDVSELWSKIDKLPISDKAKQILQRIPNKPT